MENQWTPIKRICSNCGRKIIGFKTKGGLLKVQCPSCHTCMVSKRMSRRHERIDVYAPPDEL